MRTLVCLICIALCISCDGMGDKKMAIETQVVETSFVEENGDYDPQVALDSLGIVLKEPSTPLASYVHAVRTGNLLFLAGKGPKKDDGENVVGKLGADLTLAEGYEAARWAAINQLAVLKAELGNLNRVKRIVKVKGMVNAVPDFTDHSKVMNGYSDLMVEVFGDRGKHARAAVGMGSLPGNMAVEVEMVVEVVD